MNSLKIFVANFQTSPKLRIPQGWACSGGIGPNLFEEEIGKCENHKFPIKLPPPSVKFVMFNIWWCSSVRLNLVPFSPFTCKQRSSLQSNIFWQIKRRNSSDTKYSTANQYFLRSRSFDRWPVRLGWINIKMISDVSESFPPWVFWSELGWAEIEKLLDPKFIARAQLRDTLLEKLSKFTNCNHFKLKILKMLLIFRVRKTPSACQQCWPESFCKCRKFLRQFHSWLKNLQILCYTKYPDNMQSVRMNWKVSGQSKKCPDHLENVFG